MLRDEFPRLSDQTPRRIFDFADFQYFQIDDDLGFGISDVNVLRLMVLRIDVNAKAILLQNLWHLVTSSTEIIIT